MIKLSENQKLGLSIIGAVAAVFAFGLLLSVAPDLVRRPVATPGGIAAGDYRTVSDFELTNQDGKPARLSDFRGRPVLLSFGYTQCPDVCPLTLADFKAVKRNLGDAADKVVFVMISLDPARDTPVVMKRYMGVFDPDFIGLTGPDEKILPITAQLDASYERQKPPAGSTNYTIAHTSFMYLFDREGVWRWKYPFQTPADLIAADIRNLLVNR